MELKEISIYAHLISVFLGMGAALVSDAVFSFFAKDKVLSPKERKIFSTLSTIVWIALIGIVISGFLIFFSDPLKYSTSTKFLVKMTIVGVLIVNGYILARRVQPHMARRNFLTAPRERSTRMVAFACGAVSVVSWLSALGLGMSKSIPLSYVEAMGVYAAILVLASVVALGVEKKTFE